MKTFTLDGHSSSEWNIGLSGSGTYGAPARRGESISVPGRNGALWVDDGSFENTIVTYPCWMCEDFDTEFDDFRAFLAAHGDKYYRLTDGYHTDEYRMARWLGPLDPDVSTQNKSGRFNVEFDCQPQRFLTSGETASNIPTDGSMLTLTNPTLFPALPIIEFDGTLPTGLSASVFGFYIKNTQQGDENIIGVGVAITDEYTGPFYFDAMTLVVYQDAGLTRPLYTAFDVYNSEDFHGDGVFRLMPGENQVYVDTEISDGELTVAKMYPRWWTV